MDFAASIRNYPGQPLTRQLLMNLLKGYRRPYDKISELVRQDMLIPVKRGVYIPGPRTFLPVPEKMLLANHLLGPSYVSSDSALSYHGLIPERVYENLSVTTASPRIFDTRIGRFRYFHLPLPYYSFGIQRVEVAAAQMVLIATKEKAICDKIITTQRLKLRSVKQTRDYLLKDLRISRDALLQLDTRLIEDFLPDAPKHDSLSQLVRTLNEL